MPEVSRWLRWYGADEALAGEEQLKGIALAELQRLFQVPVENPMYDCWPAKREHVAGLRDYVAADIDLERFAYFVEADG